MKDINATVKEMIKKKCTKCGIIKTLDEYNKCKNGKFGKQSICRLCQKEYQKNNKENLKEYRKNNKEKYKEYQKEWRKNNKEKRKEYLKEYRKNNKEKIKENLKEYRKNNKEKIKEQQKEQQKEYRKNNKEKYKEYRKEYRKKNKEKRREYLEKNIIQISGNLLNIKTAPEELKDALKTLILIREKNKFIREN